MRETYHEFVREQKQQLLKKKEELGSLLKDVSCNDDALSALVKVLKAAGKMSDEEAMHVVYGYTMRFSSTSSMHFVERLPCSSYIMSCSCQKMC